MEKGDATWIWGVKVRVGGDIHVKGKSSGTGHEWI
jgi:hypothetical protein